MGLIQRIRSRPNLPITRELVLSELVDFERHSLVDVRDNVIIVSEHPRTLLAEPDLREIGGSATSRWGSLGREEYNPALRGELGLRKMDEMRRSDATARMSLRLVKTPVLAGRWYMEPASGSKMDVEIAEYIWNNLQQMTVSFPQWLTEALSFLDFGVYAFEKVFEIVDGKARWRKFSPIHPLQVQEWLYDPKGGPKGIKLYSDTGEQEPVVPIRKLMVFTFDKEAGNMQGIPVLRSAYKHWYIKDTLYKIDAIQKERHGVGIPVIKLPPGFNTQDAALADEWGRNLRSNERAHLTLPPMWEVMMLKLEGQPVNIMDSIEHHDRMILHNILANFMFDDGSGTDAKQEIFLKGTRFIADIVRDVVNKWAIPELVRYNWGVAAAQSPPELRVRRIGESVDWRTISFALRNLVGAGLLVPDEPLMDWIRNELDLPRQDPKTAVPQLTPQVPGSAVPSRQSTAGGMKQQAQGTGKSNAGKDSSGGN